ncbi:hypothetical protein FRC01_006580, partial [Tulasnella sp. 417]
LWMTLDEYNFITLQRMQMSLKEEHILPNLQTLSLDIALSTPSRKLAQVCKLILCPGLASVACRYNGLSAIQDETMPQLIDALRSNLTHLKALQWRADDMSMTEVSRLCAALPSFPELRSIEISVADLAPALVQAVAQIKKLERCRKSSGILERDDAAALVEGD